MMVHVAMVYKYETVIKSTHELCLFLVRPTEFVLLIIVKLVEKLWEGPRVQL